tara:strand:+ start:554 stop:793 length:240 start_codon:yes stop_codon:yes gene_type:complete
METEEKQVLHKFWSDDRKKMAHVLYDEEFKGYIVRMYEEVEGGYRKVKSVPAISQPGSIVHSEQFAENTAENWVMGYIE